MLSLRATLRATSLRTFSQITTTTRLSSSNNTSKDSDLAPSQAKLEALNREEDSQQAEKPAKKKTMAQLDEELRQKMSGLAGDGGEAGVEMEDGQPVSMKRSVKNNMFRYI